MIVDAIAAIVCAMGRTSTQARRRFLSKGLTSFLPKLGKTAPRPGCLFYFTTKANTPPKTAEPKTGETEDLAEEIHQGGEGLRQEAEELRRAVEEQRLIAAETLHSLREMRGGSPGRQDRN